MIKNNFNIRLSLLIIVLFIFTGIMFPLIMSNGVSVVFSNDTMANVSGVKTESMEIETLVIQGAGYYLESTTVFQDLLNKIENKDILGTDYDGWLTSTAKAKELIDHAIDTYNLLIQKAQITPYNQDILNALAKFDYDAFMNKNNLNPVIYLRIKELLVQGDVIGVLKINYSNFIEISNMLSLLQDNLNEENLTDFSSLLGINEKYSEATLFGSYVARIFSEID